MMKRTNGFNTLWKKGISFLTALVIVTNTAPVGVPFGDSLSFFDFGTPFAAKAYDTATDGKQPNDDLFSNNTITITSANDFIDYCYYYRRNTGGFAQTHQFDTIIFSNMHEFGDGFEGLGHETYPFGGKLKISGGVTSTLAVPHALFTYVLDSANIYQFENDTPILLQMTRNDSSPSALLAEHVKHDVRIDDENSGITAATWTVETPSTNTNTYGGLIGKMEQNAVITVEYTNRSSVGISADGDVGVFCGTMATGSKLTVNYTENTPAVSITSVNGNAGGFVGTMSAGSTLTLSSIPSGSRNVMAQNGYAGGIVGKMVSDAVLDLSVLKTTDPVTGSDTITPLSISGTIAGKNGAGGLYGHYVNKAVADPTQDNPDKTKTDISKYAITATVSGDFCGGLFGVLDNQSASFTISDSSFSSSTEGSLASSGNSGTFGDITVNGIYGGVIGRYTTTALSNELILKELNYSAQAYAKLKPFGGAIGIVDTNAYIRTEDIILSAEGTDRDKIDNNDKDLGWFGGLIGSTGESEVFADVGNFKLSATETDGFKGGGIVGKFGKGVLRLHGTTDLTGAKTAGSFSTNNQYGQIIGENGDVLVYALGNGANTGWTFKRSNGSIADDLGTWGEVVRIADIETKILALNSTDHSVTLKKAETKMDSSEKLVLTALNIQLNQGADYDCLKFEDRDNSTRSALLAGPLTISGAQSFAGTGVNGFMRDGGDSVGVFTGTLTGGSIDLAIGEKYGYDVSPTSTGDGLGQIYRHPYNGLFAVIGDGVVEENTTPPTITSLTIGGSINVRNAGIDGMYIGGVAAKLNGTATLNNVTASQAVSYYEGANITGTEGLGKNIGGMFGAADNSTNNGKLTLKGTNSISTLFTLGGHHESWNVLGSLIGKITSPKFELDIAHTDGSLTDSHTTNASSVTNVGTNADGGGLIGFITNKGTYTDRIIKIDNLTFSGAQVANLASANGGGMLGYAWLATDTVIDGITVNNSSISNAVITSEGTNASDETDLVCDNVGAMCYHATGRWKVNSLVVSGLDLSGGAASSIGLIVNKAYTDDGKDPPSVTAGLYLDVLNAGYSLNSVTLSTIPEVYDEIAAYSALDVLKGGAGVISINMNSDRTDTKTKITETGTYQNRTKPSVSGTPTVIVNPHARYYYNLDVANAISNKTNTGENLLLWSVKQYAHSNISANFSGAASGKADLTGLSFYPLYYASSISDLSVTFDYKGIYDTAEATFGTDNPTDGYNRDPALANQHYLMQSGLFLNVAESATLTLKNLTLSGNFLEVGNYSGAVVSDTSNGSITIDGLELAGLTPMTTAGTVHKTGYLIVNNVKRADSLKPSVALDLKNIYTSTTTKYTYGVQVAKSLFGDVIGPAININLEKIRLDARKPENLSDNTALNTAYGTINSIFDSATLFNSIKTTETARLIYNYTYDEDWKVPDGENAVALRNVTYGKEVYSSVELNDQEHKYYNNGVQDEHFTDPESNSNTNGAYDFSNGWLKYVSAEYDADKSDIDDNNCYSRELKVNVALSENVEGCGTYDDPYIITTGEDLQNFAQFMYEGTGLDKVNLPKYDKKYDSIAENTIGDRWCEDDDGHDTHALYSVNPSDSQKFISSGNPTWNVTNIRHYLENAYYKIVPASGTSIELSASFVGLGG